MAQPVTSIVYSAIVSKGVFVSAIIKHTSPPKNRYTYANIAPSTPFYPGKLLTGWIPGSCVHSSFSYICFIFRATLIKMLIVRHVMCATLAHITFSPPGPDAWCWRLQYLKCYVMCFSWSFFYFSDVRAIICFSLNFYGYTVYLLVCSLFIIQLVHFIQTFCFVF